MKRGDVVVWSKKAAQWGRARSPGPGDMAGIVIRVIPMRRANCMTRPARVRIHDGDEAFYISPDFVEVANESG